MKIPVYLWLFFGFFTLNSCKNNEIQRSEVISALKNSAQLNTTEFVVSKVMMAKKQKNFLSVSFGKEATFMARTKAFIKMGVDLNLLQEEDVQMEGTKISLKLPPVEITNFSYPSEEFETITQYSDEGVWNYFTVENKDMIFRAGQTSIRESLTEIGLLKSVENNTRQFFTQLLRKMGFTEIYIDFKTPQKS